MAKLTFTSQGAPPNGGYRGDVGRFRTMLREFYALGVRSPKVLPFLNAAYSDFIKAFSGSTGAVITSGTKITVPITGTYTNGITFTIVNGVVIAGVLS